MLYIYIYINMARKSIGNFQQWSNMGKNYETYIEPRFLPYQIWWTIHAGAVFNIPGASKWAKLVVFWWFTFLVDEKCRTSIFINTK